MPEKDTIISKMLTSLTNFKVKYIQRLQTDKRFRNRENAFVVEGTRWMLELDRFSREPAYIFYTEEWLNSADNANILQQLSGHHQPVSNQIMAAISDTQTPPGVLAALPIQPIPLPPSPTLILILDELTNPGNLGTILRTAGAAGVDGVFLGPGCVDAYNPKVVRGAMGAHLRLPIQEADWQMITELADKMAIYLAAIDGELPYTAVSWDEPAALIIGGEASGAGMKAHQLAEKTIAIPMHAETESLNAAVATAVILFEAARQRQS
jgi:TrmH family RNA methyltransferase